MNKDKWFFNGGRGSGRSYRILFEYYENKVANLEKACDETQELLDKQIEATYKLDKENAELKERLKKLTIHDTNTVLKGLEMEVLKNSHRDRANNLQDQLTKAKELLKWALHSDPEHDEDFEKKWEEAEQFLNSEVEK